MAEYLCQNIEKIGGNVNYPITCAYTMALAARLLGGERFAAKAKQLADFAVTHITADGLLYGEGHPMTAVTPRNCRPVDLGYNAVLSHHQYGSHRARQLACDCDGL